ncbi:MAG: hypothetical protein HY671_05050 [Chloroflexi bacterium]|nr:hypothetical protein [Chloroflexota bacterium]
MAKRIIQVPVDDQLLQALEDESRKLNKTRSGLIRIACQYYLKLLEREKLDRLYQEGYERIPEETDVGETQLAMLGNVLEKESW